MNVFNLAAAVFHFSLSIPFDGVLSRTNRNDGGFLFFNLLLFDKVVKQLSSSLSLSTQCFCRSVADRIFLETRFGTENTASPFGGLQRVGSISVIFWTDMLSSELKKDRRTLSFLTRNVCTRQIKIQYSVFICSQA